MTNNMYIERFSIDGAAGVQRNEGWDLEFSPGINVILGDNGSGKTQTGLALMSALWPQPQKLERLSAEAVFRWGETQWKVEVDGTDRKFSLDGNQNQSGPAELQPPVDQRSSHWIGLRELLDTGENQENDDFALRIIRHLRGGLDFDDARKSLLWGSASKPLSLKREIEDKRKQLETAKKKDKVLQGEDGRRELLEREKKVADDQIKNGEIIQTAINGVEYRQKIEDIDEKIELLDPRVKQMNGREQDLLKGLKESEKDAQTELDAAQLKLDEANKKIQACRCGQVDEDKQILERCRKLTSQIEKQERRVEAETDHIVEAQAKVEQFGQQYATDVDLSELRDSENLPIKEMKSIAKKCCDRRELKAKIDRVLIDFEKVEEFQDQEPKLNQARDLLDQWLNIRRNGGDTRTDDRGTVLLALGTIVIGIAAAIVDFHWSVLIGIFGGIAVAIRNKTSQKRDGDDSRKPNVQERYRALFPNDAHFDWTDQEVRDQVEKIEKGLRKARDAKEFKTDLEAYRRQLSQIDKDLSGSTQKVEELSGIKFEQVDRDLLFVFGEALVHWQAAMAVIQQASAHKETAHDQLTNHCGEMTLLTKHLWGSSIESHGDAERLIERLDEEMNIFKDAKNVKTSALDNIDTHQKQLEKWQNKIRIEVHAKLELTEDSEHEIRYLHEQWSDFQDYRRESDLLKRQLEEVETKLSENREYLELPPQQLQDELKKCEKAEDTREDLRDQIERIKADVRNAMHESTIERFQSEFEDKKAELEKDLKESERKLAGQAVVDWLAEESDDKNKPRALTKANEILRKITRGKYEIDMSGTEISARDLVLSEVKNLEVLSAGERVQLLLAVRVGFLEANENSVRLPIFFDELLGNSDDSRAELIIQAMIELCRTGRQVFYFTAQIDEQEKLKAEVEGTGIDLRTLDLNEVRKIASAQRRPRRAAPLPRKIPNPTGHTHSEFGDAIGATGFLGTDAVESIHLWHFIDEPELLAACMKDRLTTFGQFQSVVLSDTYDLAAFDQDTLHQIEARGKAMRSVLEGFNIGRGRYVHAIDIAECNAVADKFSDWFITLAEANNGDAKRIISATRENRPKGWGDAKTDKLEEAFVEGGYIVDEEPLTEDQVWRRGRHAAEGVDLGEGWLDRIIHELFG